MRKMKIDFLIISVLISGNSLSGQAGSFNKESVATAFMENSI